MEAGRGNIPAVGNLEKEKYLIKVLGEWLWRALAVPGGWHCPCVPNLGSPGGFSETGASWGGWICLEPVCGTRGGWNLGFWGVLIC